MFPRPSVFMPDDERQNVCAALVTLAKTLHAQTSLDEEKVSTMLAEYLDVWPESVRRDLDATYHHEREAREAARSGLVPALQIITQNSDALAPILAKAS